MLTLLALVLVAWSLLAILAAGLLGALFTGARRGERRLAAVRPREWQPHREAA